MMALIVMMLLVIMVCSLAPADAQFVPGFLVESGTDTQEWPEDLSKLFPKNASPEEQQAHYTDVAAQVLQAGTVAAPLPDHNPVEEALGGPVLPNASSSPEYPGMRVLPDGTAVPDHPCHAPRPSGGSFNTDVSDDGGDSSSGDECALVAFSVARAHYKHRKAGTRGVQVLFDKVLTSVGPGFNHTGGYFRCSCPGYYHLSIHGVSPLQGRARLDLMRNRQRVTSSEAQYYGFGSAANTAIIYLYQNDIVYVYLSEGFLYENDSRFRGYASFSGFRIG